MKRALLLILLVVLFSPGLIQSQGRRTPDEIQATLQDVADSKARTDSVLYANLEDSLVFALDVWASTETVAADMSGQDNDGTITSNDGGTTDGWQGVGSRRVFRFNGDDYISISNSADFVDSLHAGMSLALAFIPGTGLTAANHRLIDWADDTGGGNGVYFLYNAVDSTVQISVDGDILAAASDAVLPGELYFVTVTINSVGNCSIYINGDSAAADSLKPLTNITTSQDIYIGRRSSGSDRFFEGDIAFAAVYKTVLSSAQRNALYHQFRQQIQPGHPLAATDKDDLREEMRDSTVAANADSVVTDKLIEGGVTYSDSGKAAGKVRKLAEDGVTAYWGTDEADTAGTGGLIINPATPQNLSEMAQRNVLQVITLTDYESVADSGTNGGMIYGAAGYDNTYYKTDTVAVTAKAKDANGGAHFNLSLDMAHFPNGDTLVMADHWVFDIYITQENIDNLTTGLLLAFSSDAFPTWSNLLYKSIAPGSLSAGWNHFDYALSSLSVLNTPVRSSIDYFAYMVWGAASDTVTFTLDNVQIIRKDITDARPNAFYDGDSTYWQESATPGFTIYRTDTVGIQTMVSGDSLISSRAAKDTVTGQTIVTQTDSSFLAIGGSGAVRLKARGGNKVLLLCSGGTGDSVAYDYSAGDTLNWTLVRSDNTRVATVGVNSADDSTLTGAYSGGAGVPHIKLIGNDRLMYLPGLMSTILYTTIGGVNIYWTGDSLAVP